MKEGLYLLLSLAQVTPTGWRKQTGLCLLTFAFCPLPGSKQKGRLPVRISGRFLNIGAQKTEPLGASLSLNPGRVFPWTL